VTRTLVVSPHLDDAVLSCWTAIADDCDVTVATVFTAGPRAGVTTSWDRDSGVDSAARMAQRRDEDASALALAGRVPVHLGVLERQYGGGRVPLHVLEPHVREATRVIAPAGSGTIGKNTEHRVVRDAVRRLRPDCWLYADQPYSDFAHDVRLPWRLRAARALRRSRSELEPLAVRLSTEQRESKAAAIRCYAGELGKLEWLFGPLTSPERLEYELFWVPNGSS
jgi:LmbE family N-acetylglucosaminyl deacetylase